MGLPLSGSPEEVELVRVETKDLTLIIKGKPFHERYESLKQYQQMDFHDVMEFSVDGEGIEDIQVYDIDQQQLLAPNNLRPIFFENGVYQLIVVPKTDKELTFYHEHPLLRQAVSSVPLGDQDILMGNLRFPNEVGYSFLDIHHEGEPLLRIMIEIFPVKLDYRHDYQQLLDEVNSEIYNLAYHFIRRTFLRSKLKLDGEPSRAEFYRLMNEHFKQFIQALKRIQQQPHHQLETTYERARGDQLRKQDSWTRNFLRKNPQVFAEVTNGIPIHDQTLMPLKGLNIRKTLTYDTQENRYVKWMAQRLIHKLTDLRNQIRTEDERWNKEPDHMLIDNIQSKITQLEHQLTQPFWRSISKLDRSMMSLVLQMAPGYRDAFQIYLTVSKGLMLQGSLYRMSIKDIALLYEYWTFLKLGSILSKKYEMISQDIIQVNNDGLYVNLRADQRAERVFLHPITNEKIVLSYQSSHANLPTTSQEPDTMLRIEKKGKDYTFNYVFDAKYRIDYAEKNSSYGRKYGSPGPMEEDINTMHRYRDAIVVASDGPYERTSFGAYVLFPWHDEHMYLDHHFYQSIDNVNIGGLPFLPNATELVERFVERLIDKSPEEIHKEGVLPKGTKEEWQSSLDKKVIVGLVATEGNYKRFIQEKYFSLRADRLTQDWQGVKYVALYLSKGVSKTNGVHVYGKIEELIFNGSFVQFKVGHWINLPTIVRPVGYGIANYMITTLKTLREAEELPELYMKKKDEMILWRMLRRVSDQIKLDLDSSVLDDASRINEYKVKDIAINIDQREETIRLIKANATKMIPLKQLDQNPTSVFKKLLELIES